MRESNRERAPTAPSLGRPGFLTGLATAAVLLLAPMAAHAEAAVKGTVKAVRIEARASSIAEILTALTKTFHFRYRSAVDLHQPIEGTFKGPLRQVLSRVLQDYDYVVQVSPGDRIEVTVVKSNANDSPRAAPSIAPQPVLPPRHRGP